MSLPDGMTTMSTISQRLRDQGIVLPPPIQLPNGALPFPWIHVVGKRVLISGHGPGNASGTYAARGRVGAEVTAEQAHAAARDTAYTILANLEREIGDLDQIAGWVRVFGMVNCVEGFDRIPEVINGFTDVILETFGPERGRHSRSAVGVAELPFGIPVEIEAEALLA